ncbi:MAG TPA: hypothetical protein PKN22_07915, partial [Taishania sp.]|nr:hypothetical protein [Taishania sp.]
MGDYKGVISDFIGVKIMLFLQKSCSYGTKKRLIIGNRHKAPSERYRCRKIFINHIKHRRCDAFVKILIRKNNIEDTSFTLNNKQISIFQ